MMVILVILAITFFVGVLEYAAYRQDKKGQTNSFKKEEDEESNWWKRM